MVLGPWSIPAELSFLSPFLRHFKIGVEGDMSYPTVIGLTRVLRREDLCMAKMQHAKLSQKYLIELAKKHWGKKTLVQLQSLWLVA